MSGNEETLLAPSFVKRLEQLEIGSRRFIRGTQSGSRRSRMLGQSLEFADYRSYTSGDDIRQVDWYAYARLGKWFLKVFLDERELTIRIYIDCSRSMSFGEPSKGRRSLEIAAALGYIALCQLDRVAVTTFDRRIRTVLPPQRGRKNIQTLLAFLEKVTFDERGDMAQALGDASVLPRRSGMTVVLTDGWAEGGYERPLSRLHRATDHLTVLHVTTMEERTPHFQGDLRLIDSEIQGHTDVAMSPSVLKRYRETYETYTRQWRDWCFRRGIGYVPVAVEDALEHTVFTLFRQTGLIHG